MTCSCQLRIFAAFVTNFASNNIIPEREKVRLTSPFGCTNSDSSLRSTAWLSGGLEGTGIHRLRLPKKMVFQRYYRAWLDLDYIIILYIYSCCITYFILYIILYYWDPQHGSAGAWRDIQRLRLPIKTVFLRDYLVIAWITQKNAICQLSNM